MAETIASMAVRLGLDISDFQKNMAEFRKTWGKLGQQMQDVGTKIGASFTAAGGAVAAGLGFAVKTAADFDAQMSRVGAIAGATGQDLEALRQTALELGASTSKSATEVAQGMEIMAAMGYNTQQVIAAMPGVIAAAEASGEDMALVAETVSAALNSFGLEASEASRVADILAQAANDSAAGVLDMQYAFKYAAPMAKQLGVSIEELAAATEIMVNAGMKGEQAGTTLRMAFIRLTDPPKEAAAALEELGVQVTDSSGNMLPFADIVAQLRTALDGMGNAQRTAALAQIFGAEAASGMLNVIDAGPEKLRELTAALENSAGASAEAAAKMKDNLTGSLEELTGAIETFQISIGSALSPAIRAVADGLSVMVNFFNQLPEPVKQMIAFGAALTAGLLLLVGVIGFLVAGFGMLLTAQWAVILPMAGFVGVIAAVVAAIGGLVAAFVMAYQRSEEFRNVISKVWQSIQDGLQALWDFVQPAIKDIVDFVMEQFDGLKEWWHQIWPDLQKAFVNIWNGIVAFITPVINAIVAVFKWAWPFIQFLIVDTWNNIKNIITSAINIITGIINAFAALFTGNWKMLWENIKSILGNALNLLWNLIQVWGLGKILKFVGFLGGQLGKIFRAIWDEVSGIFSAALGKVFNIVKGAFDKILGWITGLGKRFFDAGKGLIDMIRKGIESATDAVVGAIKNVAKKIRDFLPFSPAKEGPLSDLDKLDFGTPIMRSIQYAIPRVQSALTDLLTIPIVADTGDSRPASVTNDFRGLYEGATIIIREEADMERWSEITVRRVAMLSRY